MTGSIYRPRRSVLYTPGTRTDRVEKALLAEDGADVVVADLEDAVGPSDKGQARQGIAEVLERVRDSSAERAMRINGVGTPWYEEDLEAAVKTGPDLLVVPKVEGVRPLVELERDLERLETAEGRATAPIPLLIQLETARGVAHAVDIAETVSDPVEPLSRVEAMMFGALDYTRDVGARRTSSNLEVGFARQYVVMAAAIAQVQAIDLLFDDYTDLDGLAQEAEAGRDLGYVGKQIIHPAQIPPVHEAFTPSTEEVEEARELLAAVEEAGIGEGGVIGYQGRMIDRPVIEQARRVVALADALGA